MSYFSQVSTKFADSGSIDAFSRMRVSNPTPIFDAQFTYNLNPMLYEAVTNGSGATVTHDTTNRNAVMTFSSTPTGGKAYMQSYEYLPYQPGRSQLINLTFNMNGGVANVLKFAGYSDGVNGVEFQMNGTTPQFVVYSATSLGNETKTQSQWNIDKLDGTGVSGITIDFTKTQILLIDLQALYVGRVRVGFVINGVFYQAHEFNHSNIAVYPYIQSANLPVRCGMTCTGTVSTTMTFICAAVISEGGESAVRGRSFAAEGSVTAANGSRTHIISVRPKTTFNGFTNRIAFELDTLNVAVTGNTSILWELVIGAAFTVAPTYADVNTNYSGFEAGTGGTFSNLTNGLVIASGYCGQSTGANIAINRILSKYPVTLDSAGAVRALGTLSVLVTGLGATSASRVSPQWREIR